MTLRLILVAGAALAVACGKSDPAPTPGGGGGGGNPATTITITSSSVSPVTLIVPRGSQVTMTNNDSRAHQQASDPHPTHEECPELNAWGTLSQGQSRQTANLNTAGTCRYHDHDNPQNAALRGTIVIQ